MKTIFKLSVTILSILLLTSLSYGQKQITVSGKVISANDKEILPGVTILIEGTTKGVATGPDGLYKIKAKIGDKLKFSFIGYETYIYTVKDSIHNVELKESIDQLSEVVITGYHTVVKHEMTAATVTLSGNDMKLVGARTGKGKNIQPTYSYNDMQAEEYNSYSSNKFLSPYSNPYSTFSIDVDNAAYSNMRRYINGGQLPPIDAIRTEEFINYFNYSYPTPKGKDPINIITEISECPWNKDHNLVHIGIKAKEIDVKDLPPSNLVFLIDVSGSMSSSNRLPLVKSSLKLLLKQLRPQDRVAIVTYANNTREALPSTSCNEMDKIISVIDGLIASGGTYGSGGLQMAYNIAEKNFLKQGNNRIILATDGDFNIGISDPKELERFIEKKRETEVYLTCLGYGMGNYKDNRIQTLAEKGNGNYAYIDNLNEATKVLVNEFGGTLFTIAKDVKLQIEFNPAKVKAYRLIGYESRILEDKDFNDDLKDAGDMGVGHTVTALYEIIPVDSKSSFYPEVDDLKYQKRIKVKNIELDKNPELMTIKLRYKQPDSNKSTKMEVAVIDSKTPFRNASENFRFSAAVAGFSLLLQESPFINNYTFDNIIDIARNATNNDPDGYRKEFIRLVETASLMK